MTKSRRPKTATANDGLNRKRTRREVAEFFGVSTSAVSNWSRDGCPRCGDGFKLADVARWLMGRKSLRHMASAGGDSSDDRADPLMIGGASAALEEYRRLRCQREELELRRRREEFVDVEFVREFYAFILQAVRSATDVLGRQFGNVAFDVWNGCCDSIERDFRARFEGDGDSAEV